MTCASRFEVTLIQTNLYSPKRVSFANYKWVKHPYDWMNYIIILIFPADRTKHPHSQTEISFWPASALSRLLIYVWCKWALLKWPHFHWDNQDKMIIIIQLHVCYSKNAVADRLHMLHTHQRPVSHRRMRSRPTWSPLPIKWGKCRRPWVKCSRLRWGSNQSTLVDSRPIPR